MVEYQHMPDPIRIGVPEIPHPTPEVGVGDIEQAIEHQAAATESAPEVQPVDLVPPPNQTPIPLAAQQPAETLVKNIEDTMSEGLEDAYKGMDPALQQQFKQTGEETANAISKLLQQSKIQVKKIVTLLLRWLRLIPRVNPYYLEQQAKIKADAIVALKHPPREGN
jgi:hypothetical protein